MGFSLIELLVVVAIIAILAALAFPLANRMIAAGHTGKATANLRQIGALMASYTADNNNCLPILISWANLGSSPDNFRFWQNSLRLHAGLGTKGSPDGLWLPDTFYDPAVPKGQHLWGSFGGNNAIILDERDCFAIFGQRRGTPLTRIGPLSQKVLVATAKDGEGSSWKSSWYFQGKEWVPVGAGFKNPKPDARHGRKALCLFADGHTEALDTEKMSASDRRKYFLRDAN